MNEYYNKKTYLELVKKQIAVYERFLESIDLILAKLPENGKRFGTKWFDAINEELKEKLLATGDAILVECAKSDRHWACGIGLYDKARFDAKNWTGKNLLGFALMEVRNQLK